MEARAHAGSQAPEVDSGAGARTIRCEDALMSDRKTQCDRLLSLLQAHRGYFVPLPFILNLRIGSYTRRIHELRKDWNIEIKRDGHNSSYRLVGPLAGEGVGI
jgi:hypothetical protein